MTRKDLLLSSAAAVAPPRTDKPIRHLDQTELSKRWRMSPRTLERWRWLKQGPAYIKVGGRVLYTINDIESFEGARRHQFSAGNHAA